MSSSTPLPNLPVVIASIAAASSNTVANLTPPNSSSLTFSSAVTSTPIVLPPTTAAPKTSAAPPAAATAMINRQLVPGKLTKTTSLLKVIDANRSKCAYCTSAPRNGNSRLNLPTSGGGGGGAVDSFVHCSRRQWHCRRCNFTFIMRSHYQQHQRHHQMISHELNLRAVQPTSSVPPVSYITLDDQEGENGYDNGGEAEIPLVELDNEDDDDDRMRSGQAGGSCEYIIHRTEPISQNYLNSIAAQRAQLGQMYHSQQQQQQQQRALANLNLNHQHQHLPHPPNCACENCFLRRRHQQQQQMQQQQRQQQQFGPPFPGQMPVNEFNQFNNNNLIQHQQPPHPQQQQFHPMQAPGNMVPMERRSNTPTPLQFGPQFPGQMSANRFNHFNGNNNNNNLIQPQQLIPPQHLIQRQQQQMQHQQQQFHRPQSNTPAMEQFGPQFGPHPGAPEFNPFINNPNQQPLQQPPHFLNFRN